MKDSIVDKGTAVTAPAWKRSAVFLEGLNSWGLLSACAAVTGVLELTKDTAGYV